MVSLVDGRSGRVLRSRSVVEAPPFFAMTYTADGASLLVVDDSGEMRPVDAADLQPAKRTIGDGVDCCLSVIPGTSLAFYLDGSDDGAIDRWRLVDLDRDGARVAGGDLTFRGNDVAVSPDGATVAVTGRSGELTRIDLETGDQVRGSTGHAVDLMRVAYSDDGTRIVTGAADGAVSLWDAETLQHLGTVVAPSVGDVVASVGFVGDGHDVVIAAHDGRVYRWRVEADRTLEMGCRMAGRSLTREEWQEYLPEQPFQDVCPTS